MIGKWFMTGIFLALIIIRCTRNRDERTREMVFEGYIKGLNNGDYEQIDEYISDSIKTYEGNDLLTCNKHDFYRIFQWDSVFLPRYEIKGFVDGENGVRVHLKKSCKRIKFLHDGPIEYIVIVRFKDNKIFHLSTDDYQVFDLEKWVQRRDSLVSWIESYHPELNGFINDQTVRGAQMYCKAMDCYQNE